MARARRKAPVGNWSPWHVLGAMLLVGGLLGFLLASGTASDLACGCAVLGGVAVTWWAHRRVGRGPVLRPDEWLAANPDRVVRIPIVECPATLTADTVGALVGKPIDLMTGGRWSSKAVEDWRAGLWAAETTEGWGTRANPWIVQTEYWTGQRNSTPIMMNTLLWSVRTPDGRMALTGYTEGGRRWWVGAGVGQAKQRRDFLPKSATQYALRCLYAAVAEVDPGRVVIWPGVDEFIRGYGGFRTEVPSQPAAVPDIVYLRPENLSATTDGTNP